MIWAEYGYSANLRMSDFTAAGTLFATALRRQAAHRRARLPRCGSSCRTCTRGRASSGCAPSSICVDDRRGFWEERGYHNVADPWREQRYSYQEEPGEGPP